MYSHIAVFHGRYRVGVKLDRNYRGYLELVPVSDLQRYVQPDDNPTEDEIVAMSQTLRTSGQERVCVLICCPWDVDESDASSDSEYASSLDRDDMAYLREGAGVMIRAAQRCQITHLATFCVSVGGSSALHNAVAKLSRNIPSDPYAPSTLLKKFMLSWVLDDPANCIDMRYVQPLPAKGSVASPRVPVAESPMFRLSSQSSRPSKRRRIVHPPTGTKSSLGRLFG